MMYNTKYDSPYTGEAGEILAKLEKATGAEARAIGKTIQGLNVAKWDKNSSLEMESLIRDSFRQNPKALERLLATGNAPLTHTQDKSKWGTEFPRILMAVREELRKEKTTPEPSKEEKQITSDQYVDDVKPAEPTYKQVAEEKVRNAEIYDWEDGDTEFLGYQLKYVDSIELRDGAEVGARNPHDGTILLNLDALKVKFEEKAWRTPDRSNPNIPDFQTF